MKKINILYILIISTFFNTQTVLAEFTAEERLPESWYLLPEDNAELPSDKLELFKNSFNSSKDKPKKEASEKLNDLIEAHQDALENAEIEESKNKDKSNKPKDWVPWRFVSFINDLAISLSGGVGVLGLKGTAGASVYWYKTEPKSPPAVVAEKTVDEELNDPLFLSLNEELTANDLKSQLEPTITAALSTGKINNESNFRSEITAAALDLHQMVRESNGLTGATWQPSRIRFDIEVAASGAVHAGTYAGGALRIRLEWFKVKTGKTLNSRYIYSNNRRETIAKNLGRLVETLSYDLESLSLTGKSNEFEAKTFRVGFGISVSGNVGAAKGKAQIAGHIYFSPTSASLANLNLNDPAKDYPLYLLVNEVTENEQLFAAREKITYSVAKGLNNKDEVEYLLDRKKFREGLKKAMKISEFFTGETTFDPKRKWNVKTLKLGFDLSISGGIAMAKLTGFATTQIDFNNTKF